MYPNGTLSISAATADNEGNYLCKADNGVGEAISKLAHVGINGERRERERDDDHLEGRMHRREKGNYAALNGGRVADEISWQIKSLEIAFIGRLFFTVPASFSVPVENSTVVVGNSATVECAVEGDNPITGTRDQIWME